MKMKKSLHVLTCSSVLVVLLLCIINSFFFSSFVTAMYQVPELDSDMRCPACISFALALRKASWVGQPPHEVVDRRARRKMLNHDQRCQELLTEAMDVVLMRQAFVYHARDAVGDGSDVSSSDLDNLILYRNKAQAPKDAVGRYWSLQDLYAHRRLQVSDFQSVKAVQDKNGDESLMHFMHNEIREENGDECENLCYIDLFHSRNHTADEYVSKPAGMGDLEDLTRAGKWLDPESDWLQLYILKNVTQDEKEAMDWVVKLCKAKTMCGEAAGKAGLRGNLNLKKYMRSVWPVHPHYSKPPSFEDESSSIEGNENDADSQQQQQQQDNSDSSGDDSEKPLIQDDF